MKDSEGNVIPKWIVEKGVEAILEKIPLKDFLSVRQAIIDNPETWYANSHFRWGMSMRNFFRENCCLDQYLPSGNWDDAYTQIIEAAIKKGNLELFKK